MRTLLVLGLLASFTSLAAERIQIYPENKSEIKTPGGHVLKTMVTGSNYSILWKRGKSFLTLNEKFDFAKNKSDLADARIPYLENESDDFLLIRQGCGSGCWTGYFLPINRNTQMRTIHEYLGYDLKRLLVAYLNKQEQLEVLNLKTGKVSTFKLPPCTAGKLLCVDDVSFKSDEVEIKWLPESDPDSKSNRTIKFKMDGKLGF